jgi:hypothetical protein
MLCYRLKTLDELDKVENKEQLEAKRKEKEQVVYKSNALNLTNPNKVDLAAVLGLPDFDLDPAF